jgi:ribosomal-protein-alanine N-acetyltransferase
VNALDTARLHLREPLESDGPALTAYYARNEQRFARWEPPRSDAAFYVRWARWRAVESTARRGFSFLAFDRAQPGALAGVVNVYGIERNAMYTAMLGYNFDGAYEGRGFAREAVAATIAHTFEAYGLKKILANYNPANERSGGLLRRLGFVVEGYSRDALYLRGTWRDHVLTSLTNPDWAPPPA